LILLDSTVIVGMLDADDALHEVSVASVRELLRTHQLAASVVSYAEVMTGAVLGHHSTAAVASFFDGLVRETLAVDRTVAGRAAAIRGARTSLPMPDALILATADVTSDVELVLCADADWPKVRGLRCQVELLDPEG
jgi:predicted nucleic acid-binding protein